MKDQILYTAPGWEECLNTYKKAVSSINEFAKDFKHFTGKHLDKTNFELLIYQGNPQFEHYFPRDQVDRYKKLIDSFRKAQSEIPNLPIHGFDLSEIRLFKGKAKINTAQIRRKYFELHFEDCNECAELVQKSVDSLNELFNYLQSNGYNPTFRDGINTNLKVIGKANKSLIKVNGEKIEPDWSMLFRTSK